jgi:hypothetical protein
MGNNPKLPAISKAKGKAQEKAHDSDDSEEGSSDSGAIKE